MRTVASRWSRPRAHSVLAAAITLLAFVLRVYHLGFKGFWGDEIWTAQVAALPAALLAERTIPLMLVNYIPGPWYYWLSHAAVALFGGASPEFALRVPAAMASVLAVPVLYGLARTLCGSAVGWIAALLLAVSPYQVWYAQEARFYAWSVLLALVSTWALVRASQAPGRPGAWIAFAAANAASLYNQPVPALAVMLAQAVFIALALLRRRQRGRWLLSAGLSFAAIALLYAPVVWQVAGAGYFSGQPQSVAVAQNSFFSPSLADWRGQVVDILADMGTRFAAQGALVQWLAAVLALGGLVAMAWQRRFAALALTLAFVLAALLVFAVIRPATGYLTRYALFVQPVYLLAAAAGIAGLAAALRGRRPAQWLITGTVLAVLVGASLLTVLQGYRAAKINDWRAIAVYLARHTQPGDIITGNRWFKDAFSWYWQEWSDFSYCADTLPLVREDLAAGRRVWYVLLEESDTPQSAELAAALRPIPIAEWGQAGLDYGRSFYPLSEFPAILLTGGSGLPASIRFCENPEPGWTDRSYREVQAGQTVRFRLALPASATRQLELTYFDHPAKALSVQIDDQPPVLVGGGDGDWQTARLPVTSTSETVVVAVTGVGPEAGGISAAGLAPAVQAPGP